MTPTWQAIREGTARPPSPSEVGPLTVTDSVRYQGASGDFNPIHHDQRFAEAAGFEQPFAVGMLNAGILAAWATDWLGPENVRRFRVRFREQVWPGDTLTCSGTVERAYEQDGEGRVDLALTATRQTGGVAIEGWATFVVPA